MKEVDGYHSSKGDNGFFTLANPMHSRYVQSTRYFGIEVEMNFDRFRTDDDYSRKVLDDLDCDEVENDSTYHLFKLETDGSVDYGFELITDALDFELMKKFLRENRFLAGALPRSNGSGCGVHVHVSTPIFDDVNKVKAFKLRLVTLISKLNDHSILEDKTRDSSYASFYGDSSRSIFSKMKALNDNLVSEDDEDDYDYDEDDDDYDDRMPTNPHHRYFQDRYACVNFINRNTIEFRFFDYTQDTDRLVEYIEFVNKAMDICTERTIDEIGAMEFTWTNPSLKDLDYTVNVWGVRLIEVPRVPVVRVPLDCEKFIEDYDGDISRFCGMRRGDAQRMESIMRDMYDCDLQYATDTLSILGYNGAIIHHPADRLCNSEYYTIRVPSMISINVTKLASMVYAMYANVNSNYVDMYNYFNEANCSFCSVMDDYYGSTRVHFAQGSIIRKCEYTNTWKACVHGWWFDIAFLGLTLNEADS